MHNKKIPVDTTDAARFGTFDPEAEARVEALMGEPADQSTNNVVGETIRPKTIPVQEVEVPIEHLTILPSAPEVPESIMEQTDGADETPAEQNTPLLPLPDLESVEATIEQESVLPETEDPALDAAVDDITIAEADAVLAAEDAKLASTAVVLPVKSRHKILDVFKHWWGNPVTRWATILVILGGIITVGILPQSRYYVLNTAGVRGAASVTIIDATTGQPLQNVLVKIGERSAKTNESGFVRLQEVKLGTQQLVVSRVAFATINKQVTLGWGSNPLGELELKATGVQYVLQADDYLSGKPVVSAKAANSDSVAQADEKGKITLTLEDPNNDIVEVTVTADGYRTEKITLPADTKTTQTVRLVPAKPVVYVTKHQGTYDVYRVDADGTNRQVILKGTGLERPNMGVITSDDGSFVAVVSSREKRYDSENYLLDTLSLINLKTGAVTKIDQAQSVQLVAWKGNRLVYRAAYAAPSAATNDRQRLVSYNVEESARTALANGNYFVGIYETDEYIYYGVSTPGSGDGGMFARIKFDGTDKKTLLSRPIWSVSQTKPHELYINAEDTWYLYDTTSNALSKQQSPQGIYQSVPYFMAPNKEYSVFIDQRDGQGVLVLNSPDKPELVLASARSIYGPVTWLNSTTVSYYADTGSDTAVYAASIQGGNPVKINTATIVSGAE